MRGLRRRGLTIGRPIPVDLEMFGDPSFDDPAAWTTHASWTITGGQAVYFSGSGSGPLTPVTAVPVEAGVQYRLVIDSATAAGAGAGGWIALFDSTLAVNLTGYVQIYLGENVFLFTPAANHANVALHSSSGNGSYTLNSVSLEPV